MERHSLYFPMKEIAVTPEIVGLPYEEIYFNTSDDKRLNGWFIPSDKAKFTVILCHGNGGNISHRLEKITMLRTLGLNTLVFDYRGYGKSDGAPSESGLYKDVDAAYNYLIKERKTAGDSIILYGESLGGAVAIDLAHRTKVRALIIEDTFTSVKDMARITYPLIPYFVLSAKFNSISKIKNVTCPKLIIHSINDEIIPFRLGEKLFDEAEEPKRFLKTRGGHNTAFSDSAKLFVEGIGTFLNELQ